jgi:hypothetical protein
LIFLPFFLSLQLGSIIATIQKYDLTFLENRTLVFCQLCIDRCEVTLTGFAKASLHEFYHFSQSIEKQKKLMPFTKDDDFKKRTRK